MKKLTSELIAKLGHEAANSPRLRKNFNFHQYDEVVQRFINVMQPNTYVTPHCHPGFDAFEFYCILQGRVGLILFSDSGEVLETYELNANGPLRGVEIPGAVYHSVVCLEPNSTILEVKEGPYNPTGMKYTLSGFPDELAALQGGPQSIEAKKISEVLRNWTEFFVK
jgi:cupin fold WbuC family metalloprotein